MISEKLSELLDKYIDEIRLTEQRSPRSSIESFSKAESELYEALALLEIANARLERQLHEMRDGIDPLDSNPGRDVPALALAVSLIEGQDGFIYPHEYFAVVALTVDGELQPVWINTIDGSLANVLRWWHLPEVEE